MGKLEKVLFNDIPLDKRTMAEFLDKKQKILNLV